MGRCCSCLLSLVFSACSIIALQLIQLSRSQKPGFVSIDCGSNAATIYRDPSDELLWVGDTISEGKAVSVIGGTDILLSTMRLFDGDSSKYCYTLTEHDGVAAGALYLVRATIWAGIIPPYNPVNPNGNFRFKLIVDADVWDDAKLPYGIWTSSVWEIYVRAQRSSIAVCFARDGGSNGDAPFVSTLELRPLPSSLTSAALQLNTSVNLIPFGRADYVSSAAPFALPARFPLDPVDRIWSLSPVSPSNIIVTTANVSTNMQADELPARILQTAYTSSSLTLNQSNLVTGVPYLVQFYFAEIDPRVNASGQRAFHIYMNGNLLTKYGPIDVFKEVGANAAFSYSATVLPNSHGIMIFNFSPVATSIFQPFCAAAEFFRMSDRALLTNSIAVAAVDAIKASLNLSSYTGDPCLPAGFGYDWLQCSDVPEIDSILLGKYGTGGEVPAALNNLTALDYVDLNGNNLRGSIPDLSGLVKLSYLDLSNNELTGSIPNSLAGLKNLQGLYLQNNQLSGLVPAALLIPKDGFYLNIEGNPLCYSDPAAKCSYSKSKKSSLGSIVGGIVAGILVVIGICIALYCFCKKRTASSLGQKAIKLGRYRRPVVSKAVIPKLSVSEFTFDEIKVATRDFCTQLGKGGFGPVYEGKLQNGRLVAIKVASDSSKQGLKEFLNEVDLLSRVHHKDLVELLGYCNDKKLVLVYEFMSNGSLFDWLHGPSAKISLLSWGTRLRILVEAAQGLSYLHHGCNPRIIHRDVKSSNILLNDQLEAKISDFGISRNSSITESAAVTTALMGSMGYIDPEYLATMRLTEKVDLYSFGVLLFEVVCRKPIVFIGPDQQQTHISEWAKFSIDRGVLDDIVDASLCGQYDASSMWKVLETALACVAFPGSERPNMSAVVHELKEAERMERESNQANVPDKPTEGSEYNSKPYTHVSTR